MLKIRELGAYFFRFLFRQVAHFPFGVGIVDQPLKIGKLALRFLQGNDGGDNRLQLRIFLRQPGEFLRIVRRPGR